jgi:hypothetical protein
MLPPLIFASQSRTPMAMNTRSTSGVRASVITFTAVASGAALYAAVSIGCGNEPAAATPPQPSETPAAASTGAPAPEPSAAASAAPSASASAKAAADPPKQQGSGRPAVRKHDDSEITDTFGSTPASKLELGDKDPATLQLPEGALRTGTLITFKLSKGGGKTAGAQLGKVYEIKCVNPPSANAEQIESNGPPFVLEMPAGAKKDANLAIGVEDDKGKVKWTIVASKSFDDGRKVAIFELPTLPSGFVHLTTKAASGPK